MSDIERKYIAPLLRIDGDGVQLKKLSHHHLAIMDYMLTHPTLPLWHVAEEFNRSQAWLSTVINSDLFQAHLHERRKLMEDAQREALSAKLFAAASNGMDKLIGALDDDETSVAEKRAITRMALESQGMLQTGRQQAASVIVNNNNTAQALAATDDNKARVNAARERILQQSRMAQQLLSQPMVDAE